MITLDDLSICELEQLKQECDRRIKDIMVKAALESFERVAEAWTTFREVTARENRVWVTVDGYCDTCCTNMSYDMDVFEEMDALIRDYKAGKWTP